MGDMPSSNLESRGYLALRQPGSLPPVFDSFGVGTILAPQWGQCVNPIARPGFIILSLEARIVGRDALPGVCILSASSYLRSSRYTSAATSLNGRSESGSAFVCCLAVALRCVALSSRFARARLQCNG